MAHAGEHGHDAGHHVSSIRNLVTVWGALVVLTVVTVWSSRIDFGPLNLWIAIGIAGFKASLVVLWFMHMRYERPFNAIVFIMGVLFVVLFIGITLMDVSQYVPELIPDYAPDLQAP